MHGANSAIGKQKLNVTNDLGNQDRENGNRSFNIPDL